jgi:hypothetical protein
VLGALAEYLSLLTSLEANPRLIGPLRQAAEDATESLRRLQVAVDTAGLPPRRAELVTGDLAAKAPRWWPEGNRAHIGKVRWNPCESGPPTACFSMGD